MAEPEPRKGVCMHVWMIIESETGLKRKRGGEGRRREAKGGEGRRREARRGEARRGERRREEEARRGGEHSQQQQHNSTPHQSSSPTFAIPYDVTMMSSHMAAIEYQAERSEAFRFGMELSDYGRSSDVTMMS